MGLIQITTMIILGGAMILMPLITTAQTSAENIISLSHALLDKEEVNTPENISHDLSDTEVTITCHVKEKDDAVKLMNETETLPEEERTRFVLVDLECIPVDRNLRESGYLVIYKREKH